MKQYGIYNTSEGVWLTDRNIDIYVFDNEDVAAAQMEVYEFYEKEHVITDQKYTPTNYEVREYEK